MVAAGGEVASAYDRRSQATYAGRRCPLARPGYNPNMSQFVEPRMAKSYYIVPVVKRALLPFWYEVWDNNPPFGREAEKNANLRQSRIIKASNKTEAATIAEAENPGYVVI